MKGFASVNIAKQHFELSKKSLQTRDNIFERKNSSRFLHFASTAKRLSRPFENSVFKFVLPFSKVKFEMPRVAGASEALVDRRGRFGSLGQPFSRGRPASVCQVCGGHGRQKSFVSINNFGVR